MVILTLQYSSSSVGLISGMVFAVSMITLYTSSCLYHGISLDHPKAKHILQLIDRCSIFILIAGSGTPFVLCAISKLSVLAAGVYNLLMWSCAILGIILLCISLTRFKRISIVLYLIMGLSFFAQNAALKASLGSAGYMLLLGGGILYCVGLIFYSIKIRWTHSIFHVLCVVASAMHCVCILLYVI